MKWWSERGLAGPGRLCRREQRASAVSTGKRVVSICLSSDIPVVLIYRVGFTYKITVHASDNSHPPHPRRTSKPVVLLQQHRRQPYCCDAMPSVPIFV